MKDHLHESGPRWKASIECESGMLFAVRELSHAPRHPSACEVEAVRRFRPGGQVSDPAIEVVSPISEEHAVKVATEKRQEWLRNREMTAG